MSTFFYLNKYSKLIEPAIKKLLISNVERKHRKLLEYQISTGGKRLRPALAIISCQLLGGKIKDVLYPAAGLEILHNYSLIIDDIIDHSNLRRGKPTVWLKFGKSIAECVAVVYSAAGFQGANLSKKPAIISEIFAKTMKTIVDGEILDILFEQEGRREESYVTKNRYSEITEEDYFKMASKKTATLFQTCCEVGGICAQGKKKEIELLKSYGFNLGIAFQITDDILDIFGEKEKFGKKIGKDIEERKGGNIIILYALKSLSQLKRKKLQQILKKEKIQSKDINAAIEIIKETKAREKAISLGEKYIQKAKENLNFLPKNKWNKILFNIADFILKRKK